MKSLIIFATVYAPPILTMLLVLTLNKSNQNKPIASKWWCFLGYLVMAYIVLVFALLGIGLDSFSYFETPEAKKLRKYNLLVMCCGFIIGSLLGFKNVRPKDR